MDISQITDYMLIGTTPIRKDQNKLLDLGVTLIINMQFEKRPQPDSLIPTLWLPTFDSPLIRIPVKVLKKGVEAALEVITAGGRVYVHCHGGVHRAVAMGCSILIANGYSLESAMTLVKLRRQKADPEIWYIRRQISLFDRKYGQPADKD
jgi:protein-tyrosine phosphatase